jgi:hypothetical protein
MANYNGRQPNNTAYVKNFVYGSPENIWKVFSYTNSSNNTVSVITPSNQKYSNLYIPGDLFVDGNIINPSDIYLKENIDLVDITKTNKILNLKVSEFTFKDDSARNIHYGFIAQEFEKEYPELVCTKPDKNLNNIKAINYLEIIPLLVSKIQLMQKEIDELKESLNNKIVK